MILVDSSVWIDFFRGRETREVDALDALLGKEPVAIGDLILAEVLQGFPSEKEMKQAKSLFEALTFIDIGGRDVALLAVKSFRTLRARGITVRKTIDTMIAARCMLSSLTLLHSDRDFDPFVEHMGLKVL